MTSPQQIQKPSWLTRQLGELQILFYRYADRYFSPPASQACRPPPDSITAYTGKLSLELVSHCWNYSHMMVYHLSSLVNYPPNDLEVTATVFYCPEDTKTQAMLDFFGKKAVHNIQWNWQPIPKEELFRRAIGRNRAALATQSNWIWYIDCDLIFHDGCLDSLCAALQGRKDALLYPESENITTLLEDSNPVLQSGHTPQIVDIDTSLFSHNPINRAVGAYQITHGDIARACGYCQNILVYQTPTEHWRKTYEDRSYRWLLGTQGEQIPVNNIYRIRHISKGRYKQGSQWSQVRAWIRQLQSKLKGQ